MSVLIFGGGWLGQVLGLRLKAQGLAPVLTSRDPDRRLRIEAKGLAAIDPAEAGLTAHDAWILTAPPDEQGCPALRALTDAPLPAWIGYVSSTAVYGDRAGGWVFEDGALNAASLEGARRIAAEAGWTARAGDRTALFRLPALYGPGRSALSRVRSGQARLVRKPDQIFNRIHVQDVAAAIALALGRRAVGAFNLTDDEPTPAEVPILWAARALGLPAPPEVSLDDPEVSEPMRRFYRDCKRVSNARAKAVLGWRPAYPSFREGLAAELAEGIAASTPDRKTG